MIAQLICLNFRQIVFPHFTDLVLWRAGRKMAEHKDDGYPGDDPILNLRHFSAVTYCNDDYGGGETFIRNEHGGYYLSTPRIGSLVFYPSDERCPHGVNEVLRSDRVTLSTWFTRDFRYYRA
jgi:predicted 2-oxoglutarate/Fe(II)-dependent dioxygenase YbiX